MATLSVLKFNDPGGADRVLIALEGLQERQMITLEDAAVVRWPAGDKKPKTPSATQHGRFWRKLGRFLGISVRVDLLRAVPRSGDRGRHGGVIGIVGGRGNRR